MWDSGDAGRDASRRYKYRDCDLRETFFSEPDLRELLPRSVQTLALLHQLLATLGDLAWLLDILSAACVAIRAPDTQTTAQRPLESLVAIEPKDQLVVDGHRDVVAEPFIGHCMGKGIRMA